MKLHDLQPNPGSKHRRKRVGRGISAGQGKTAGRGTKGQGARQGGGPSAYFEGGNLPFVRKLPFKRGFTNLRRVDYQEVSLGRLDALFVKNGVVTPETLATLGVMKDPTMPVVVLGDGELTKPLTVKVQRVSATARAAIEKAGGTVELLPIQTEEAGE
ncbi:MAG TPA: 50S ribosomal protein L15 [Anaerolineales bacterium]|nr:50S ribosomal protein L15 [Anaerolineales bacterium]